jgi:TRAP-type C4-dicarboxylate transport system permease small subunit
VFTRYVLGTGSQWPEPIAILLMVVFTFIGARRRTAPAPTSRWPC